MDYSLSSISNIRIGGYPILNKRGNRMDQIMYFVCKLILKIEIENIFNVIYFMMDAYAYFSSLN